ncbi:MAG TPA: methionyl-tRNA formyltransferase [Candidatus Avidehalobacter gallistercoris]|uniref:Methionyl-tRNA formyltransferase n=1 Tax=Candidatus Avidehalobacter gallistercoris TaxID=2840694 RepID=A0A9D1KZN2_9FIRM|nr:methionyl-tRNA formyltransferase [Candidatus Avidehalobacter gallistercoris]
MTETNRNFRIIYFGSPDFAVPPLLALLQAGYDVPLAVTQPDRPKGRKRQLTPTAVRVAAEQAGIRVIASENANQNDVVEEIDALKPDLLVVAAFGQIMHEKLVHTAKMGAINIHGSLLPEYRGASPIQQALLDGRNETGVTIMYIASKLDAGDMLARRSIPIEPSDNTGTLREKLSALGTALLLETIEQMRANKLVITPQDETCATYAGKITADMERLNWQKPAETLHNLVRALTPDASAYCEYAEPGKTERLRLKVWQTQVADLAAEAPPGTVVACNKEGLLVATGKGALKLITVQPAGKNQMNAAAWWRGRRDFQQTGLIFV